MEVPRGQDFLLFCSLMYPVCVKENLVHRRSLLFTEWVSERMKEPDSRWTWRVKEGPNQEATIRIFYLNLSKWNILKRSVAGWIMPPSQRYLYPNPRNLWMSPQMVKGTMQSKEMVAFSWITWWALNVITSVLIRGREAGGWESEEMEQGSRGGSDTGPGAQVCGWPLGAWKAKEVDFALEPPEGTQPWPAISSASLQDCEKRHLCCLQPLSVC